MEKWNIDLDYADKKILAPMVRVGTLPFRMLCLKYGADIVYGEELVTFAIKDAVRVENNDLNTIDFVKPNGQVVYRTCDADMPTVFQLGAADAVEALAAANVIARDVVGIDLNMGCPKHFSIQGGMGAALLEKPEIVTDILSTLVRNLPNNITCKIRLKETVRETVEFMKICESTGIKAMAVHARRRDERPKDDAHWDEIKEIIDTGNFSVPIILNGDVFKYEDIQKSKDETGADSVMIARGASCNPAIFQNEVQPTQLEMAAEYVKTAIDWENHFSNTKYVATYICKKDNGKWMAQSEQGQGIIRSKGYDQLCKALNIQEYWESSPFHHRTIVESYEPPRKKQRTE